ncbi:hypothetical protein AXF42_Ash010841 [Apostasia shenzhenica]|uniref:Proteasome-associated protein ECM29 like n=1 Tax=Apostasia shenzhenica TaxID=1088818 RepID=A0A2I0A0V5_9ASPA|nr:hypothetical protein AXF42_Ash010841 [Apostasia shenzhenica]
MAELSPASQPSDAEREEMLDRMLTRLALADDSKLEQLLSKILPYSISSLSCPSPSIRKLVMEILTHINKRVKHRLEIGLPVLELWKIYCEAGGSPMDKANMAPDLLITVSKLPTQHQDIILRIVCKVIGQCHSSKLDEYVSSKYKAITDAQEQQLFVEFCLHTVLYQPPSVSTGCPAGLSMTQSDRVTGKVPLKGDHLLVRKLGILNVIEAMQLIPELVYPIYLAAAADSEEQVVKRGEELLKREASSVNLDDSALITKLFILFNGTTSPESVAAEFRVTPVSFALRMRVMSVLCRSIAAANSFPSTLQCIFDCIYGSRTTSRLKQSGMEFTIWVFISCQYLFLTLAFSWPTLFIYSNENEGKDKHKLGLLGQFDSNVLLDVSASGAKSFAFQAIGLLAGRMPHLFREKIDMAVRLFSALNIEDQSLRLTIQESVTALAVAYKDAPSIVLKELETLLLQNCQVDQSEVRFCAVRWATSLFNALNCTSRYICMLGSADAKMDIREMALEGLYLTKNQEQLHGVNDVKFPKLKEMLNFICSQQPKLLDSSDLREKELLFSSTTYLSMVNFLMKCFKADCSLSDSGIDWFSSTISVLCLVLEHAMAFDGSVELHATSMKALLEIGSHFPKLVASRFAGRLSWLKVFLGDVDFDTRESASKLLGITCSAISAEQASALISDLVSLITGSKVLRFENHHGLLCAIGYVTAECMKESPTISEQQFASIVDHLVCVVESESPTLASVAMEALGHIGLRHPLPILDHNATSGGVLIILNERLSKLLDGNDIKSILRIVVALGHISVKETSLSHLNNAVDLIFRFSQSKVEDALFAAGEALSFVWGGVPVTGDQILKSNYSSLSQTSNFLAGEMYLSAVRWDSSELNIDNDSRAIARDMIVHKLFGKLLYSSSKEERCASTVWLVSLTMYCGQHPKIQQLLPEIQEVFSHHLGDNNVLTQELASQGMSIVYELGDSSMKQDLVNALVNTLTGSGKRKRAIKARFIPLMEDSEIFQEGAIGESLSGGKLSTYKELCSLANEMGQPDLIYKFMDLANYQASLNSKRGAAFGFSKIAKQAGDALQPHLRELIPRLVRYQYDPDKNIQDAMGHIWKSLIADTKRTIDEYFDDIVEDLLIQSGSRLWRSREASSLALADIIQGRKYCQVSKHLKRIWTAAFRSMDDIKETVRNSGDSLCRSVSSLTIRLCDISLTPVSDARETMDIVLPLLLGEGIVNKVSSIQKASIGMVMKLSKISLRSSLLLSQHVVKAMVSQASSRLMLLYKFSVDLMEVARMLIFQGAGAAIRPHLPDLVCCMLECLSSLEDQRINYVELHAANVGIQTEKLENLRIAVAKDSAMWETLDLCIKVIDKTSLDSLVPRLAQLVRSGVGLNTRVGVANFITLLVQKVTDDIIPFTNLLSKLLFQATLEEKSGAAKRSFAAACAIVLRYGSPSLAQKLIEDTVALHLGDRSAQIACAVLLKRYLNLAADLISSYQISTIPVIFISRFEDYKDISALYEELWEDNSNSERVTIQLYLEEIVSLICSCLSSSSWASKRKGKDVILQALAVLCSSCQDSINAADPVAPVVILNAITSACTKKEKTYCEAAFSCLQQVVRAFKSPEFFNKLFPMLCEICDQAVVAKTTNVNAISTDPQSGEERLHETHLAVEKVIDCVTACIHVARVEDAVKEKKRLMHVFLSCLSHGLNWAAKSSVISSVKELCSKVHPILDEASASYDAALLVYELCHDVIPKLLECVQTVKISQFHATTSECILEILRLYRRIPPDQRRHVEFKDELIHLSEVERSEQAKTSFTRSIAVLEELDKEVDEMI